MSEDKPIVEPLVFLEEKRGHDNAKNLFIMARLRSSDQVECYRKRSGKRSPVFENYPREATLLYAAILIIGYGAMQ